MGSVSGVWPWTGWEEYEQGRINSSEQHSTQCLPYSKVDLKTLYPVWNWIVVTVFLYVFTCILSCMLHTHVCLCMLTGLLSAPTSSPLFTSVPWQSQSLETFIWWPSQKLVPSCGYPQINLLLLKSMSIDSLYLVFQVYL